jgi:hypothetical protein
MFGATLALLTLSSSAQIGRVKEVRAIDGEIQSIITNPPVAVYKFGGSFGTANVHSNYAHGYFGFEGRANWELNGSFAAYARGSFGMKGEDLSTFNLTRAYAGRRWYALEGAVAFHLFKSDWDSEVDLVLQKYRDGGGISGGGRILRTYKIDTPRHKRGSLRAGARIDTYQSSAFVGLQYSQINFISGIFGNYGEATYSNIVNFYVDYMFIYDETTNGNELIDYYEGEELARGLIPFRIGMEYNPRLTTYYFNLGGRPYGFTEFGIIWTLFTKKAAPMPLDEMDKKYGE